LRFFAAFCPWQGQRPGAWATVMSVDRGRGSLRHHTRLEVLPPSRWRWPRDVVPSSAPEKRIGPFIPSDSTGRRHGFRAPVRFRLGGGAAHVTRVRPAPPVEELARGSTQPPRAQGAWPRGSWACTDAARPPVQRMLLRLPPGPSREASGAPAPRPTHRATCG
jgi:hypothetical protein